MKTKVVYVMLIIFSIMILAGCGNGDKAGGATGLNYVVAEARENNVKGEDKDSITKDNKDQVNAGQDKGGTVKKVYLTFDDGPESINTPLILNILDNYGVKATFFVIGTSVEKNPAILKEIYRRGHAVGNHTYNHVYREIYANPQSFLSSIKKNEELIFRLTGERPWVIRDPGGIAHKNKNINDLVVKNGYSMVQWNIDSNDSGKPYLEPDQIINNVKQQAANKKLWPGMIILMHDGAGHLNTVHALPTIIELLMAQGFEFEVLK